MRIILSLVILYGLATAASAADLPRSQPEEEGVPSAAIQSFLEAANQKIDSLHSFVLLRHGKCIAEAYWTPYDGQTRHQLYSLSKSFTSTAVGLAISEGKLSLDDPVLKFFPDEAPANPSANLKSMRVSDLLRMSTGHQTEPGRTSGESWAKTFLAHPVPFKPGTHFVYNTSATYMLSAIVQKATGQTLLDYLKPRLFDPLGIENPTWETSPQEVSTGGYGLSIRTKDIASFGQLYLQKGKWNGTQLIPAAWVEKATSLQTSNGSNSASDWDQGYGYQFWRCRHGAYRGDGAFGQYCLVLPEQDAVIAITSGLNDMQAVLNLVWDKLLPAFSEKPLVLDQKQSHLLEKTCKTLMIRIPETKGPAVTGSDRKFVFTNAPFKLESLSLQTAKLGRKLIVQFDGKEQQISCGNTSWLNGEAAWAMFPTQPIAACGNWTSADTFTAKICFRETPFITTLQLKFVGDELQLKSQMNVGFGPTKEQIIVGKAK